MWLRPAVLANPRAIFWLEFYWRSKDKIIKLIVGVGFRMIRLHQQLLFSLNFFISDIEYLFLTCNTILY